MTVLRVVALPPKRMCEVVDARVLEDDIAGLQAAIELGGSTR